MKNKLKEIKRADFFKRCKGAKLVNIENFTCPPALYESTAFTYRCADGNLVYKIETRSLKPHGYATYSFFIDK